MAKKLKTKIGDVFSIPISESEKRYMQLIAFDLTQLNSDVVRIFEKKYLLTEFPLLTDVLQDSVYIYAHCATDFGLKMNLWVKEGNSENIGRIDNVLFRDTNDYGKKVDEESIRVSNSWFVWKINDEKFTRVGKLTGNNRNSYIGLVINPLGIVELAKGNKCPPTYPDYE